MVQCIFFHYILGENEAYEHQKRVRFNCDACSFNYEQPQDCMFTEERLPTCYLKTIGCKLIVVTGKSNFLSYLGFNRYRVLPKGKKK